MTVRDLRSLKKGVAYTFTRMPSRHRVQGVVGKVRPDMDHPNWGTVYDEDGEYLVAVSYGEWLDAEESPQVGN